jgi:peptidoglycan lytic transglycosylase
MCAALALPAAAWASSGGTGVGPGGSPVGSSPPGTSPPSAPTASSQSADATVSTTGNGVTLSSRASGILLRALSFSGTAPRNLSGDTVEIERSGHQTNWRWAPTVSATVASDGSFSAVWQTNHIGRFAIRAVISRPSAAQTATVTPSMIVTVYRPSKATLYGPGFYGKRTACGQKLRPGTIGVANRTLRCGESVAIYYQGRTLVVPVIDRGPYANGADWDLTMATGRALGVDGTAQIDAVSLPNR